MCKVVLTIRLQEVFAKLLNGNSWPENRGLRILSAGDTNILIDSSERDKNGSHPNPLERIFDLSLSSLDGKIKIIFGSENNGVKREVDILGRTEIIVTFPKDD